MQAILGNAPIGGLDPAMPNMQVKNMDKAAIQRVSQEYEGVFLAQMMQQMFADVNMGGLPGGDEESGDNEVYRSFLVDEYGRMIARNGGIGVSNYIQRELLKLQEAQTV